MDLPENTSLPFFAYGIFQPGELAFLRLSEFVQSSEACSITGELKIRDGLTLLAPNSTNGYVHGSLLYFHRASEGRAYYRIIELEPDKQYEWRQLDIGLGAKRTVKANVLIGRHIENGCSSADVGYAGRSDPLFSTAFEIIDLSIRENGDRQPSKNDGVGPNYENLLRLQMAYMLLWTSIERYVTLRHGLGGEEVMRKVLMLSADDHFCKVLKAEVKRSDRLFPTNDASTGMATKLNNENPKSSLKYYYQVRCNITHRGKAAFDDFDRLYASLSELTRVFKSTLENAFKESESTCQLVKKT